MPIKKFTSFADASTDLWILNPDKDYYRKLKDHFSFWSKLSKQNKRKEIQKFSSYDEYLDSKEKFQTE